MFIFSPSPDGKPPLKLELPRIGGLVHPSWERLANVMQKPKYRSGLRQPAPVGRRRTQSALSFALNKLHEFRGNTFPLHFIVKHTYAVNVFFKFLSGLLYLNIFTSAYVLVLLYKHLKIF